MTMKADFDLGSFLKEKQMLVNAHLKKILHTFDPHRELIRAMDHSLTAGGKRLRPALSMAAAQAVGCGSGRIALPAGCAIEMIHTYSLIHDDLPGMDNDDFRRGRPSCHRQFSEATAILAGDALLTHAFYVLSRPESLFEIYPALRIRMELIGVISEAAGINGMVEGQMLDMQSVNLSSAGGLDFLKTMHALKTGKMITVSIEAGALSAGAESDQITRLKAFGDKIGLAFQVVDDILNVAGDPEKMGKSIGSDQVNGKLTFPSLIGLEASKRFAADLIQQSLDCLSCFDESADPLRAIGRYVIHRDR